MALAKSPGFSLHLLPRLWGGLLWRSNEMWEISKYRKRASRRYVLLLLLQDGSWSESLQGGHRTHLPLGKPFPVRTLMTTLAWSCPALQVLRAGSVLWRHLWAQRKITEESEITEARLIEIEQLHTHKRTCWAWGSGLLSVPSFLPVTGQNVFELLQLPWGCRNTRLQVGESFRIFSNGVLKGKRLSAVWAVGNTGG